MLQTKEEWEQYVNSHVGFNGLIYHMDGLSFPELNSLIQSGAEFNSPYFGFSWGRPVWLSIKDHPEIETYSRLFSVLKIYRQNYKSEYLCVIVADIDDGDNCWNHEPAPMDMEDAICLEFMEKFGKPILDIEELLLWLKKNNFKKG